MFIDSHCHLDFPEFDSDRQAVIDRAQRKQVSTILVPSVSRAHWQRTLDISRAAKMPFALGLHPMFIEQHQPHHLNQLDAAVTQHQPAAVGEIGLDFYDKSLNREKQQAYFSKQLIIAKRHDLPVVVHCRKAHDECLLELGKVKPTGGIIHAFNGSLQQARHYIDLGFLLGFGGMLTYARSNKLRKLVDSLPLEAMVLETDAPDMTVAQHQGERNNPEYIPLIAQAIAEIKGVSVDRVATVTSKNFLLKLPASSD